MVLVMKMRTIHSLLLGNVGHKLFSSRKVVTSDGGDFWA